MSDSSKAKNKVDELKNMLEGKNKPKSKSGSVKSKESDELNSTTNSLDELAHLESGQAEEVAILQEEIEQLKADAKESHDKMLRAIADSENFKRRSAKELQDGIRFANEKIVNELLPVIDNLDRVLQSVPEKTEEATKAITTGVELVRKEFEAALSKFGVVRIQAKGEFFDPNVHEAVGQVDAREGVASNMVVEELRAGYKMHDRLIRAAMVMVAK